MLKKLMIVALSFAASVSTYADAETDAPSAAERRAQFESMTPEERRAAIAERRGARGDLSDAEREARRERFRNMSPEDRAAIRERRGQRGVGRTGGRRGATPGASQ